ncbi:methylated-DNA--[protein]-cysteine S-methyltransferase [Silvimonas amylolytica]|nr:methylated-DNA--[protein]-cysteine S-methyltransferase [Silvimonas amylolytica]
MSESLSPRSFNDDFTEYQYDAVIDSPVGRLGLIARGDALARIDFALPDTPLQAPQAPLLLEAARQLAQWFADPYFEFDLPLKLTGSHHELAVWEQIAQIPCGQTRTYAEIAAAIGSVARAVGGACGQNPIPLVIPCHRVVAANGVGGFNAHRGGVDWVPIKRQLLLKETRDLFSDL